VNLTQALHKKKTKMYGMITVKLANLPNREAPYSPMHQQLTFDTEQKIIILFYMTSFLFFTKSVELNNSDFQRNTVSWQADALVKLLNAIFQGETKMQLGP
jgi:hypothetical protein